ncbi:hypothetical protein, partial [Vibrio vulnificus]|uniref:hypothetical protein n=1 Tax=Vibrio vulnificus TaxID=672 RepID=UPI001CA476FD
SCSFLAIQNDERKEWCLGMVLYAAGASEEGDQHRAHSLSFQQAWARLGIHLSTSARTTVFSMNFQRDLRNGFCITLVPRCPE